jgi:hypothetical protein
MSTIKELVDKMEKSLLKCTGYSLRIEVIPEVIVGDGYFTLRITHIDNTLRAVSSFSTVPVPKGSTYYHGELRLRDSVVFSMHDSYGRHWWFLHKIEDDLVNLLKSLSEK